MCVDEELQPNALFSEFTKLCNHEVYRYKYNFPEYVEKEEVS